MQKNVCDGCSHCGKCLEACPFGAIYKDVYKRQVGIYQKEGKYYGVPMEFNLEYGGMIVNKKLFDDAGISYPKTWEDLRKVSKEVSRQNEMCIRDSSGAEPRYCRYIDCSF